MSFRLISMRATACVWLFAACLVGVIANQACAQSAKRVDDVFKLRAISNQQDGIDLQWSVASGYYLYREKISATFNGEKLKVETSTGEMKDDPTFGVVEIFRKEAIASVGDHNTLPEKGQLLVTYQGCGENTICYPPTTKVVDLATLLVSEPADDSDGPQVNAVPRSGLKIPGINAAQSSAIVSRDVKLDVAPIVDGRAPSAAQSSPADDSVKLDGGYIGTLFAFFGFGLLLSLTPCIFPMIPILSGMLASSGRELSVGRSFVLSASYVLAMAAAYGFLGVFAGWSGGNLQALLQTPVALGCISFVFVALAFSMFGYYDLQLPQSWSAKLAGGQSRGSIGGAALLGFGSALIVGPCVTPPLAAALLYVAQTGNIARGSSALFALGLGMGVPMLIFGSFGAKALPRSGPWLVGIKHVFGVMFLGLAFWMVSRLMPLSLIAAGWGVLLIGLGVYLGTQYIAARNSPLLRHFMTATASVLLTLYGGILVAGAAFDKYEPMRPLVYVGLYQGSIDPARDVNFRIVSTASDLDEAIAAARGAGKTMLVDFSAEWCTECKIMERTVFSEANVQQKLNEFSLIRVDMTNFDRNSKKLMARFDIVGPPTMIFLDRQGTEITGTRIIGFVDAPDFLNRIAKALRV
jgi:thiol:disulfide interchange protein DsbD